MEELNGIYYRIEGTQISSNGIYLSDELLTLEELKKVVNDYLKQFKPDMKPLETESEIEEALKDLCDFYSITSYKVKFEEGIMKDTQVLHDPFDLPGSESDNSVLLGIIDRKKDTLKDTNSIELQNDINLLNFFLDEANKHMIWNTGIYKNVARALLVRTLDRLPKDKELSMNDILAQFEDEATTDYTSLLTLYDEYRINPFRHNKKITVKETNHKG